MSTQHLIGRFLSRKSTRLALVAGAALAFSMPSVWAITSKQAAALASSTISALIAQDSPSTFPTDAANAIDSLADANSSVSDSAAIVKAALGTISDSIASGSALLSGSTLLAGDQAIGAKLVADPTLEALSNDDLITILQDGIVGITGLKGKSQIIAPEAAAAFVAGIVSTTLPDGVSDATLAVDILKNVSKNTSVDEFVAFTIGSADSGADLVNLATTLFSKYPKADTKITQGITAVTTQGVDNEALRIAFVQSLTTASVGNAVAIDAGAVFVDPFYGSQFTSAVFNSIISAPSGGSALAIKDAGKIATAVGETLGQDGDELTQVANVFSELTGSDDLPAIDSATYAKDLIKGAVTSAVPSSQFSGLAAGGGGGKLLVGNGKPSTVIAASVATDLASILDLFADGIVNANGVSSAAAIATDAKEISGLAKNVASFVKNEGVTVSVPNQPASEPVAVYLAGTLGEYIASLSLGTTPEDAIFAGIVKGVTAITNPTVDREVKALFASTPTYTDYTAVGVIAVQETTVTNL